MFVLLRTSMVSLDDLEGLRRTLLSKNIEAYASVYPLENDVHPALNLAGLSIAPHSFFEKILETSRKASKLPSQVALLVVTKHPGIKHPLLLCSEKNNACVIACPLDGECQWDDIIVDGIFKTV